MNQQLKAALISYLRLFLSSAIACYLLLGKQPLELGPNDWHAIGNAAIGALIVAAANALNPKDERYGVGAPKSKQLSAGDVETNTGERGYSFIELLVVVVLLLLIVWAVVTLVGR